jgi:hypothetical protein
VKEFTFTDTKPQLNKRFNNPIVEVQEYRRPLHGGDKPQTTLYNAGNAIQNELDRWGNKNENWVRRMLPSGVSYKPIIIILRKFFLFR